MQGRGGAPETRRCKADRERLVAAPTCRGGTTSMPPGSYKGGVSEWARPITLPSGSAKRAIVTMPGIVVIP